MDSERNKIWRKAGRARASQSCWFLFLLMKMGKKQWELLGGMKQSISSPKTDTEIKEITNMAILKAWKLGPEKNCKEDAKTEKVVVANWRMYGKMSLSWLHWVKSCSFPQPVAAFSFTLGWWFTGACPSSHRVRAGWQPEQVASRSYPHFLILMPDFIDLLETHII